MILNLCPVVKDPGEVLACRFQTISQSVPSIATDKEDAAPIKKIELHHDHHLMKSHDWGGQWLDEEEKLTWFQLCNRGALVWD